MLNAVKNRKYHKPTRVRPASPALPDEMVNKALMQRFELAFVRCDLKAAMACLGPGFEWRLPTGETVVGRKAVRRALRERFSGTDGPRFRRSRFKYYGNTVVQTYRVSVPDGKGNRIEVRGCDVYKLRRGLLVRKDAYWKSGPTH